MSTLRHRLGCRCGEVALEVRGKPILSAECLCADCQKAGAFLQSLHKAPRMLDRNGATRLVLYRKDRVQFAHGTDRLREHRLSSNSATRRVVATCCNTPMFLEVVNGHWLSLYGCLWSADDLPALEIRTMTKRRPQGVVLPDDVPNPASHTFGIFAKLLGAWIAMGFRRPKIDFVTGSLDENDSSNPKTCAR